MGRILTNNVSLAYAVETSLGVVANPSTWEALEPNDIGAFGGVVSKKSREPISKSRQRRKGVITDLDSTVDFSTDLTREAFREFAEGFLFATAYSPFCGGTTERPPIRAGTGPGLNTLSATTTSFDHSTITTAMVVNRLLWARGFSNAVNNGLHVVNGTPTVTSTKVATTLVAESPTEVSGASVEIAGHRFGTGELSIVVTGTTAVLTRATTPDFTTLGLKAGQVIHVGGLTITNQFAAGKGYARITAIAAATLALDRIVTGTLMNDAGTGKSIDLLYGQFIRNVDVDAADGHYLSRSYQFQLAEPGLISAAAAYEYAKGNQANEMDLELPLSDKAGLKMSFVGQDVEAPTESVKPSGAAPIAAVEVSAFSTPSDIARLRLVKIDETGLTTLFKRVTVKLNNQTTAEKGLGTLGAVYINQGVFLVDLDAECLFTSSDVVNAIRNNTTVRFDTILKNEDGAIALDIPSLVIGNGGRSLPVAESVLITLSGEAFKDPTFGYSVSFSLIPTAP